MHQNRQITLKGSAQTITQFLEHSFYSILYQRGIYPAEDFQTTALYGIHLIRSCNSALTGWIQKLLVQIKDWISRNALREVAMIIGDEGSGEALERWQFKIALLEEQPEATANASTTTKGQKEIEREIQALMKQIAASVTFLPLNEGSKFFDVVVHVRAAAISPEEEKEKLCDWHDSSEHLIPGGGEVVEFRTFSTQIHQIKTSVTYRVKDDE